MESKAPGCAMVVFGASGDLTRRKLLAGLFELCRRDLLDEKFYLVGCGRTHYSDEQFREIAKESIKKPEGCSEEKLKEFLSRMYYISGDYNDPAFYGKIQGTLARLDKQYSSSGPYLFYLALPPDAFPSVIEHLGNSSMKEPSGKAPSRVIVEKPFGRDYKSAVSLNQLIGSQFSEGQIYRIDHYLAKETVQNILVFRFGNSMFEPIWNRNYIDHVQITIAESLGVEHRAGYYDKTGALRDMFQNHLMQVLTLVGMEPPASFEADRIRDEKVKLLRAIRPLDAGRVVRGQYTEGVVASNAVPGYREEEGVTSDSNTETYVASEVLIDNWRWKGVPFYLRTGKRLARQRSEIAITFKTVPHSVFEFSGMDDLEPNVLVFEVQPHEGISLSFQAKSPGAKTCISQLSMAFTYKDVFKFDLPDAYERVLLDCMNGDQTLFTRSDEVELAWRLFTPVLEHWTKESSDLEFYPAGSESFEKANAMMRTEGRYWRAIE